MGVISDLWLNMPFRPLFILLIMVIKKKKFKNLKSFKAIFIGIYTSRRIKRDNKVKIYPKIHELKEVSCLRWGSVCIEIDGKF